MKRILYILFAGLLLLAGFTSCADETMMQNNSGSTANGDIHLKVNAHIPAPKQVITRDIDPDGLGVNSLWLFCFNNFGEYIGRREVVNFENAGEGDCSERIHDTCRNFRSYQGGRIDEITFVIVVVVLTRRQEKS